MHNWWKNIFGFIKNTWIGDAGASCHITNNDDGIYDVKTISKTENWNSGTIKATKLEKKKVQIK